MSQQSEQDEVSRMDDFEIVRERRDVMTALARLTDRHRKLNAEMSRRQTLRWMLTLIEAGESAIDPHPCLCGRGLE